MKKMTCKYPNWTREDANKLLDILGEENARKLLAGELRAKFFKPRASVSGPGITARRHPKWSAGQIEALLNILGEENARKLLAGELRVELVKPHRSLFNRHGIRIRKGLKSKTIDPDISRRFGLEQLMVAAQGYLSRIKLLYKDLGRDVDMSDAQILGAISGLRDILKIDPRTAKIVGRGLPVVLPPIMHEDIGAEVELLLGAVQEQQFRLPDVFMPRIESQEHVFGRLSIREGSGYGTIMERRKKGPVPAIFFPDLLQGFSLAACFEQISSLPKGFFLSGHDVLIARAMYADILRWKNKAFIMFMAALRYKAEGYSVLDGSWFDNIETNLWSEQPWNSAGMLFVG